jgi:hypothetical protein
MRTVNYKRASLGSVLVILDPCGTPYEIAFESTNYVMIRCAGKTRSFGDKDDVTMSTSHR